MKKISVICVTLLLVGSLAGCYASSSFHKDYFDTNGNKIASVDATMRRPMFAAMDQSWTETTGKMSSNTSFKADQFMNDLLSAYLKYQTGGLASAVQSEPQAVLVPKAAAATPPPAEVIK